MTAGSISAASMPQTKPLIGLNVPWFHGAYGHDLGPNSRYPDWPVAFDPEKVAELLDWVQSFGLRTLRIWLCENAEGLVCTSDGRPQGLHDTFLANLEVLAHLLSQANMRAYWVLLDANSVLRNGDHITRSILVDPYATERFAQLVMAEIEPLIRDVLWGVDVCNEPEALVAGPMGNGMTDGVAWSPVLSALERLCSVVRQGARRVSFGSGYHEGYWWQATYRSRLGAVISAPDVHTYLDGGRLNPKPPIGRGGSGNIILGEFGSAVASSSRTSSAAWRENQAYLAAKVHKLASSDYYAAFLWYLSALDASDASAVSFRREAGSALVVTNELLRKGGLRA